MQDCLADPPHRVRDELDVLLGVVLLRGVNETDVPLVDEIEEEHVGVAVALRVRDDEAEVRFDELLHRRLVVLLHTTAELLLTLGSEAGNACDLLQILVQQIVRVFAFFMSGHRDLVEVEILRRMKNAECCASASSAMARNTPM